MSKSSNSSEKLVLQLRRSGATTYILTSLPLRNYGKKLECKNEYFNLFLDKLFIKTDMLHVFKFSEEKQWYFLHISEDELGSNCDGASGLEEKCCHEIDTSPPITTVFMCLSEQA